MYLLSIPTRTCGLVFLCLNSKGADLLNGHSIFPLDFTHPSFSPLSFPFRNNDAQKIAGQKIWTLVLCFLEVKIPTCDWQKNTWISGTEQSPEIDLYKYNQPLTPLSKIILVWKEPEKNHSALVFDKGVRG